MPLIPRKLQRAVRERAAGRCEYCRLSQSGQIGTFHLDHIQPQVDGGPTAYENLAVACQGCSGSKSDKSAAIDPQSKRLVRLFNPRIDRWNDHFRWQDVTLVALTAIARATIHALKMNREEFINIRRDETARGRHPPKD